MSKKYGYVSIGCILLAIAGAFLVKHEVIFLAIFIFTAGAILQWKEEYQGAEE